jgi:WD40 repeat protein
MFSRMVGVPGDQYLLCSDGPAVHIIDVAGFKYVPKADFTGDAGTVNLRFKEVGKPVWSNAGISALACAPKEQKFAGVADKVVQIWDLKTGRSIQSFNHPGRVTALAYSPDGHSLLTGCEDKTVRLWDVTTGKELRFFPGDTEAVQAVAFSGDGRLAFTAGNDKVIRVWDLSKPAPEP